METQEASYAIERAQTGTAAKVTGTNYYFLDALDDSWQKDLSICVHRGFSIGHLAII